MRGWIEQAHGLGLVKRLSRHDLTVAHALCRGAAAVLSSLPARGIPRAQLAAETLGDAHALDDGMPTAALVIAVLRQRRKGERALGADSDDTAAERRRETWAGVGVLVNELARPVLCLNLPGAGVWGEPAYLSLRSLLRSPRAWAVDGQDIYVCENPNLLAIAADLLDARCKPLICTEGMPAAAQRTLMEQLVQAGGRLHYHGDFDWPGLAIGNQVIRVFEARPWRFGAEDYLACVPAARLPGSTLKGAVVMASWDSSLTEHMHHRGISIPEEAIADVLIRDLRAG